MSKHLLHRAVLLVALLFAAMLLTADPDRSFAAGEVTGSSPEGGALPVNAVTTPTPSATPTPVVPTATPTPQPTPIPNVLCVNMELIANTAENIGVPIVQSGSIDGCMPDIQDRIRHPQDERPLGKGCFDDFTTQTNLTDCGDMDDWMWWYWLNAMPIEGDESLYNPDAYNAESLVASNPWAAGGITVALNVKGDGTCTINGPATAAGACDNPNQESAELVYVAEPISFIWGSEPEPNDVFALFPMDLREPGKFYQWQASSQKPLLVFDPEHSGKITSAIQLFGNWAFGGKQIARVNSGTLSDVSLGSNGLPWKDGYEALASLDTNGDDKLSGAELEHLALWFDSNRDAVSQEGEVKRLGALGVDVIYVKPDQKDPITGDIIATRGFERVLSDGTRITGKSVDWMAKGYNTPQHIASFEIDKDMTQQRGFDAPKYSHDGVASYSGATDVSGVWKWRVSTLKGVSLKHSERYEGLLLVKADQGKLQGGTMIESATRNSPKMRALQIFKISGHTELNRHNKLALKFEAGLVNSPKTMNDAELIDSTHMEGTSKVEIGKNSAGKPIFMTYSWKAEKLNKR